MTRLQEIEERLSQINTELDAEDVDFEQLELELDELNEERSAIIEKAEKRNALQERIANLPDVKVIEQFKEEERNQMTDVLGPESVEYRSAFIKKLMGKRLNEVEERAFLHTTENTNAVVPVELQNQIFTNMKEQHPILKDVKTLNSGGVIAIVKHTSIDAGDAKVVAEGQANEAEENTFVQVKLDGKKFTKFLDITDEMSAMAIPAFEDFIVQDISDRIGAAMARDIVEQIGEDVAPENKVTTDGAVLTVEDTLSAFAKLKGAKNTTIYANSATLYGNIAQMAGRTEGQNAFILSPQEGIDARLLGKAIKEEDAVPDGQFVIVDPNQYILNVVSGMQLERDRDIKASTTVIAGRTIAGGTLTNDKAAVVVSFPSP